MEHKERKAMKTLEKAEELFKADDFRGAAMLAQKAWCLCPSLEGLFNVLIAYRTHAVARENKLPSGDTDWHAVLGVPHSSNPEVIKEQYKKSMRHFAHPNKIKSAAAEGALKLLEEAWSCISSSFPPTPGSTTSPETQNMTSRPSLPPSPDRSAGANLKPAFRNSDGKLLCPYCQAEFAFKIAGVDHPVLCKCRRCHGCSVVTPENGFNNSSPCRQPENDSPPPHTRTSPPPPPGTAQATSFTMPSSSQSSKPNFLRCPFCGTGNNSQVIDGTYHVTCKQCGVASSIKKDGVPFDKSDQAGRASPPSSQTGIALCRKCHTPYDGEIPNNRRILRRCKLCGSWASIKLEIKQIIVEEDQLHALAADLPNQSTPVVRGSGDDRAGLLDNLTQPSDSRTPGDLVRCPSGGACKGNYL